MTPMNQTANMTTKSTKKITERMCIGCREMKDRGHMIRVVRQKDGGIFLDETGKAQGRGAYICKDPECLKRVQKSKGLERSFKASVPTEIYEVLAKEMEEITCKTK